MDKLQKDISRKEKKGIPEKGSFGKGQIWKEI